MTLPTGETYFIAKAKISLIIDPISRRILAIVVGPGAKPWQGAKHVELRCANSNQRTYFRNRQLYLDGLALLDIMIWLWNQSAEWTGNKFIRQFEKMFSGEGFKLDAHPKAALAAARGGTLPGELQFFKNQIEQQHPDAFAALQRGDDTQLLEIVTQ